MERFMAPSSKLNPGSFSTESCQIFSSIIRNRNLFRWCIHGLQMLWNEEQFPLLGGYFFPGVIVIIRHTVYKIDWLPIPYCLWTTHANQWESNLEPVNKEISKVWVLLGYLSLGQSSKPSLPCFSKGGILVITYGHVRRPGCIHSKDSPLLLVISVTCNITLQKLCFYLRLDPERLCALVLLLKNPWRPLSEGKVSFRLAINCERSQWKITLTMPV